MRPVITACLLAGVTLLLYGFRLSAAPPDSQEAHIVAQAQSGHGPIFFHVTDDEWLQPVAVYAAAAVGWIGGGDASARIATVVFGALNVALLSFVARLVFDGQLAAFVAPLLLLTTPAHIAFSRSGTDAIVSVPFVLLWLLAILRFWRVDTIGSLLLAGAALGAGVYTNRSAPLTMSLLMIVSLAALTYAGRKPKASLLLVSAFAACLLPAAAWFAFHLDTYADTFGRWAIHLAHLRNPLEAARAFFNWNTLGGRASLYWGFLDPSWLFFDNMLLLVMLPLLLLGLAVRKRLLTDHATILVAGGALVAPLAGSSFGRPHYAADALAFLPFAALLATTGVVFLVRQGRWRTYRSSDTVRAD